MNGADNPSLRQTSVVKLQQQSVVGNGSELESVLVPKGEHSTDSGKTNAGDDLELSRGTELNLKELGSKLDKLRPLLALDLSKLTPLLALKAIKLNKLCSLDLGKLELLLNLKL